MSALDLSRRSFLRGTLAVAAATALPARVSFAAPMISGDGIHDDTLGLQAALRGDPFRVLNDGLVFRQGGVLFLTRGVFKLSDTIVVTERVRVMSVGNVYDFSSAPRHLESGFVLEGGASHFAHDYFNGGDPTGVCIRVNSSPSGLLVASR